MGKFGTLSLLEDLAIDTDPIGNRAEEIAKRFAEALDVQNALFADMVGDVASVGSEAELPYPGSDRAIIQELDEWGAADASKASSFGQMGFPLRIYGGTVQWTNTYIERATPAEMATNLDAFATEDLAMFRRTMAVTLFKPTNTTGYWDRLATKRTYDLKALLNADGQAIPGSPSGAAFNGATHTHYLGSASLTASSLQALIDTVVEHGVDGQIVVYIAKGDESTVRGLTGFSPYLDARVTVTSAAQIGNQALDVTNPNNRAIGVFGGAEVWVKSWIPTNYQAVIDIGASVKPLRIRTRTGTLTGSGSFRLINEHGHYPLHAQHLGREYGLSVYGRQKAAVAKSDNATYSAPTIA